MRFVKAIPLGSIVEITATIKQCTASQLMIDVKVCYESKTTEDKVLAITAQFVFVAVDEKNKLIRIKPSKLLEKN